jgi:spore maturation protein CgeB
MALILTESPYLDAEQVQIVKEGHVGIAFTNDKSSMDVLSQASGRRVEYLPHSYDPMRHHKKYAVLSKYESDIFFFGTWWPERKRLLQPVQKWAKRHGYKACIDGVDFERKRGMLTNRELIRHYSGTKIALNHHRSVIGVDGNGNERHVNGAYSLGPRAYEIAACGTFQLCDDSRPELEEVFGAGVVTYSDGDELREMITFYMEHEDERQALADIALRKVRICSFEARARDILLPAIESIL